MGNTAELKKTLALINELREKAKNGDTAAKDEIKRIYEAERVKEEPAESFNFYRRHRYNAENYKPAKFDSYCKAAEAGDAAALRDLACFFQDYRLENGLQKGRLAYYQVLAQDKYSDLAEIGDAETVYSLAEIICSRREFKENYQAHALYWCEKAAALGSRAAALRLAHNYTRRWSIPERDLTKAAYWYEQAAELGSVEAMAYAAEIYFNGTTGAEKDPAKAAAWFEKAENNASTLRELEIVTNIRRDCERALENEKAALAGDVEAMLSLSKYFDEDAFFSDKEKAAYWYEKAAEAGKVEAMLGLAEICEDGQRVRDRKKAAYWFEKAALAGDAEAALRIGQYYLQGEMVQRDLHKALAFFQKAAHSAEVGIAMEAAGEIAYICLWGWGVARDREKAAKWYGTAARLGSDRGWHGLLNISLLNGDFLAAAYWYAKESGNSDTFAEMQDFFAAKINDVGIMALLEKIADGDTDAEKKLLASCPALSEKLDAFDKEIAEFIAEQGIDINAEGKWRIIDRSGTC